MNGKWMRRVGQRAVGAAAVLVAVTLLGSSAKADPLRAGVGRVDITNAEAGPVHDRLYAKALVLKSDSTTAVIITVDAVAIAEIGAIHNDYLAAVRGQLQKELAIQPDRVLINASHCHGAVCADVAQRTVQAVKEAHQSLTPVTVAAGVGQENRVMENRRLQLADGRTADVRHAYSLPPDNEVVAVGPVDPEIGVLRLDRKDGRTLAVVYNFACHPIQGVPGGGNTADLVGFASHVIEDNLGGGAMALFLQGCAGDVNPLWYKDVDHPRDAEPLGTMLGLSALQAIHGLACRDDSRLNVVDEIVPLPRADWTERIARLEAERAKLVESLQGTSLNLKTFLPLIVKYQLSSDYPSYYSHRYLHDTVQGREDLTSMDAENRRNMDQYVHNIHTMEQLTRIQTNLALLKQHQAQNAAAAGASLDVEVMGLRVGDFVLIAFPGELSVQIGMNIKQASPHDLTFVSGCSNGYIYYAPTAEQLGNPGAAQEDCDCLLAPAWQQTFEQKAQEILKHL
jgi:hypothetical protein